MMIIIITIIIITIKFITIKYEKRDKESHRWLHCKVEPKKVASL